MIGEAAAPLHCDLCNVRVRHSNQFQQHLQGHRHAHSVRSQLITRRAEEVLGDLSEMNSLLLQLGQPEQRSKVRARAALQQIYINIYDLIEGRLKVFTNRWNLRAYTLKSRLIFPLEQAKAGGALKHFLRVIF